MCASRPIPQVKLDWNELRDLLSVVEAGSLSAAARSLGVSQSTMSRRIAAIEARGLAVFEPGDGPPTPTPLGAELAAAALAMRAAFAEVEAILAAAPPPIRVAACEVTARLFLADAAAEWARRGGPPLDIDVLDDLFSVRRSDYDVIVTPTCAREEVPAGVRLGAMAWGLYSARRLGPKTGEAAGPTGLDGLPVIQASGSLSRTVAYAWFAAQGGDIAMRASSPTAQLEACARGQGVALLPRLLGDPDPRLTRLDLPVPPASDVWMIADARNATTPRVAGFLRWARSRPPLD